MSENSFDVFWKVFPRRVSKFAARTAFDRALKLASADAIIAGAQRYAAEKRGSEVRFIKHPTTWLNQGCWEDEEGANANGRSAIAACDRLIERFGGAEAARAYVPGSGGPESRELDRYGLPVDPRLLPSR